MEYFDQDNFFDRQDNERVPVTSNEYNALNGYFEKRGFSKSSSRKISVMLLEQANNNNIPVFQLIDTLNGLSPVELNTTISQILNFNRTKSSTIGFSQNLESANFSQRNIII